MSRLGDIGRALGMPLLRGDEVIGVFALLGVEPGPFTPSQIELVQTFADQAVIAIENVRLFNEVKARTRDLSEALQQQTATADVFKVISRSAFDLQAVLDTLGRLGGKIVRARRRLPFSIAQGTALSLALRAFGYSEELVASARASALRGRRQRHGARRSGPRKVHHSGRAR